MWENALIMWVWMLAKYLILYHRILSDTLSREETGLEIATNMVANGTNFFSLATKIFV